MSRLQLSGALILLVAVSGREPPLVWSQLQTYLKRSADQGGEVALRQDGAELVRKTNLITDESPFARWYAARRYAGNWASAFDQHYFDHHRQRR